MRRLSYVGFLCLAAIFSFFSTLASADEDIQIQFSIGGIGTNFQNVRVELRLNFGAELNPNARRTQPQFSNHLEDSRRVSAVISYTDKFYIDSQDQSGIVYGRVVDLDDQNSTARFIPITYFQLTGNDPEKISLLVVNNSELFFENSWPFVETSDTGFMNNSNSWPTLLAIRSLISYFDALGIEFSDEQWDRLHSFFKVNRGYVLTGNAEPAQEILKFLASHSDSTDNATFHTVYAEFLNELLMEGGQYISAGLPIKEIVDDYLQRLYLEHFVESHTGIDQTIEILAGFPDTPACLEFSMIALENMNEDFLVRFGDTDNVSNILLETANCVRSIALFANDISKDDSLGAAEFIYGMDGGEGKRLVLNYVEVVSFLDTRDFFNPTISQTDELLFEQFKVYREVIRP